MTETVARAARALQDADLGGAPLPMIRRPYLVLARTAIAALREPSGRMWSAGRSRFAMQAERYRQQTTTEKADIYADTAPADIWRAMIDAALGNAK